MNSLEGVNAAAPGSTPATASPFRCPMLGSEGALLSRCQTPRRSAGERLKTARTPTASWTPSSRSRS
eukprot:337051-Rhodomonas_salina.3